MRYVRYMLGRSTRGAGVLRAAEQFFGGTCMSGGERERVPLTDEQQRLVRENIGLVSVHLRRYVGNLAFPRRDREWDDLFQEGCLGLIQAAVAFRQERGIPFAAFALARIHNAVSRALHCKFSTVHVPPQRNDARSGRPAGRGSARALGKVKR